METGLVPLCAAWLTGNCGSYGVLLQTGTGIWVCLLQTAVNAQTHLEKFVSSYKLFESGQWDQKLLEDMGYR